MSILQIDHGRLDSQMRANTKQKSLQRAGMSTEQRKRHEALDFARANVELSGGKISEKDAQESLRWANGEITMDEYLDALRLKIALT